MYGGFMDKMIQKFYDELFRLHDDGALPSDQDEIALKILNAIDDAMGR
jgi:hypothetical protein